MTLYACKTIENDWLGKPNCIEFVVLDSDVYEPWYQALAISSADAGELALVCCLILFLGWVLGLIGKMMIRLTRGY